MRFRFPIPYTALAVGALACSVYDASLLPADEDEDEMVITASGGVASTISSGSTMVASIGGATQQSSGSGTTDSGSSTGGGDSGSGGDSSSTTGSDGGTGGATDNSETTTSTGGGTTTGSADGGTGGTGVETDPALIDDLEDGNTQLERPTYSGYWYTAVDETGSGNMTPEPGEELDGVVMLSEPRGDSMRAMHVTGQWEGDYWAAALGFSFLSDDTDFDATGYTAISFWARSDQPMTNVNVQMMTSGVLDDGHWYYEITDLLSEDWQQITIAFDDAIQPTWADEVLFDESTLYKIQFQFNMDPFDLWIDDIRFEE